MKEDYYFDQPNCAYRSQNPKTVYWLLEGHQERSGRGYYRGRIELADRLYEVSIRVPGNDKEEPFLRLTLRLLKDNDDPNHQEQQQP
jgi:hypothetical protein